MTSRPQTPLVGGRSDSENLIQLGCVNKCKTKRASDDETNNPRAPQYCSTLRLQLQKKHSRTSPEIQFKDLNEKLKSTLLISRSVEKCQPKYTQNHLKQL